jgi:hypothetical protein
MIGYFFNSDDPDTVTVHSRKNGANGNLTCSTASQSNALGQDTSNSDSIAVGVKHLTLVMISVLQDKAMVALVQVI